ncbi:MAG: flagellar hook-basal body complex protein [Roseburia sp.]|nr:flagellar hook-basal body complex protein [Roseburia sp.]
MMRSLFSAVSGLKTHQTRMDVIGNNVANVNTVAFKSSGVTFSELMYQTISGASGANDTRGGVNAKQIGLGVSTGSTKIRITSAGAAESTGDPFDVRLTDTSTTNFFIVNNGSKNLFTRAGSFYIDGAGNLCMTSTGYTVMGWQVDDTTGDIRKDQVSALKIMQEKNLTSAPEATTNARAAGVMDKNDSNVTSDDGYTMILNFFDALGYNYVAKFSVKVTDPDNQQYTVELSDILDSNNHSVLDDYVNQVVQGGGTRDDAIRNIFGRDAMLNKTYTCSEPNLIYNNGAWCYRYTDYGTTTGLGAGASTALSAGVQPDANGVVTIPYTVNNSDGTTSNLTATFDLTEVFGVSLDRLNAQAPATGNFTMDPAWNAATPNENYVVQFNYSEPTINYTLKYSPDDGTFTYVGDPGNNSVTMNLAATLGGNFSNINIDFSESKSAAQGGKTTLGLDAGALDKQTGVGRKLGAMIGISINGDGRIYGSYDNGNTELLGQIAVAQFANASGLEKIGENCYDTTLNSGDFDGIGVDISADGSKMTSGELEMSNVDLSTEFTSMIITQRGFQSNSRVITTSDTLLEELINLKR